MALVAVLHSSMTLDLEIFFILLLEVLCSLVHRNNYCKKPMDWQLAFDRLDMIHSYQCFNILPWQNYNTFCMLKTVLTIKWISSWMIPCFSFTIHFFFMLILSLEFFFIQLCIFFSFLWPSSPESLYLSWFYIIFSTSNSLQLSLMYRWSNASLYIDPMEYQL